MICEDVANKNRTAYSQSVAGLLGIMHGALWHSLENFFLKYDGRKILTIIGPGRDAFPYSFKYKGENIGKTNKKRMKNLGLDETFFLDYTGLEETFNSLNKAGFFEENYFVKGPILNSSNFENFLFKNSKPTITGFESNLIHPLPLPSEISSAVECSLTAHHVTITKNETRRLYGEFFRILKKGGMLHLGEGDADMDTEKKLLSLSNFLSEIVERSILFSDEREMRGGNSREYLVENRKNYSELIPYNETLKEEFFSVRISQEGFIYLCCKDEKEKQNVIKGLTEKGFSEIDNEDKKVIIPIIDRNIDSEHIRRVDEFYEKIFDWICLRYSGEENVCLRELCNEAVNSERGRARRGIGEYYRSVEDSIRILREVGFKNIRPINIGPKELNYPFYNLVAFK